MADLNLLVGQSSTGTVNPVEADGITVTPGATLSNISWSISDPGITLTPSTDNTALLSGAAATAGDITGQVLATVTDGDGTVNSFSKTFTVNVGGVTPPTGRTAGLGVTFSTPA